MVQLTDDGREVVIAWGSRKLAPREVRYSTIEKELYACVWSLQNFENYIYGKHVEIQSDHRPLAWLKSLASQKLKVGPLEPINTEI